MTNAEKFEEVFGMKPDLEYTPMKCPEGGCENCQYKYNNWNYCENWWNEEYIDKVLTIPIPEKVITTTAVPTLIKKDAPSIVDIFACPHLLPCGWCEKRDMLCNQKGIQ